MTNVCKLCSNYNCLLANRLSKIIATQHYTGCTGLKMLMLLLCRLCTPEQFHSTVDPYDQEQYPLLAEELVRWVYSIQYC